LGTLREEVERFLERERAQLPSWLVVGFGAGIAAWFALLGPEAWVAVLLIGCGLALAGFFFGEGRLERAFGWFGIALALGCALVWSRAEWVAAPTLDWPRVTSFTAKVERVEPRAAKGDLRLTLAPADPALPPRVRVSIKAEGAPAGIAEGAELRLRARLAPPPPMALPGTHDFARDAWFKRIGAVGRALGQPEVLRPAAAGGLDSLRDRLGRHIREQLPGSAGTIATALATGDQNAVGEEDAEAMRRSGLAHLLSVSGLHIAAVVGATMLLMIKLLALSERVALRFNVILIAAAAGALVGVAYTLLTGAQVPTVRSCIAALLVLAGIALGRDALSLRLVAVGALVVLLFRPEAVAGGSFQFSFAAVTAIIALHSSKLGRRLFLRREEGRLAAAGRLLLGMIATGLAVELALIPFALYHFHKAGLYGVAANLVAIPLTTFVIMPLEAGALLLDLLGLGAPLWWLAGLPLDAMLWIAHTVANARGAVATLASMPLWAFALMVLGGLWLCLWTTKPRLLGAIPFAIGAAGAALSPTPDLLVTGDGRHLAIRAEDGTPMLLRDRSGDFVRDLIGEASGFDNEPGLLSAAPFGSCSRDACVAAVRREGGEWRLLATRSTTRIDWQPLVDACAQADIVVSERWLPRACTPRWLKLDRKELERTGGVAVYFGREPRVDTVAAHLGRHPWSALTRE
jgi:competence protein ComEC